MNGQLPVVSSQKEKRSKTSASSPTTENRQLTTFFADPIAERMKTVTEYRQRFVMILNAGAVAANGGTVNVSGDAVGSMGASTEGTGG